MRIGEFAKKHNITQDTIRHYLDMGLLITKKEGSHYRFGKRDSEAIIKIIELKELGFSLMEIQEILSFNRLAGDKTDEYKNYYIRALENKKKEIEEEQKKYEEMESNINKKINRLKINKNKNYRTLGLPMSSIEIIRCPNCKKLLNIYDAIIEENMFISGKIICGCGYSAIIENGIYIEEEFMENKILHGKNMPSKQEFLDKASSKFINFYYDGMEMLIENIKMYGGNPRYIMELETCGGTFLMPYIKYLPEDSTYIILSDHKDRLSRLKNNIELHHNHRNFIFFCCDIENLPIKNSSIDIIIDHWMTKNYGESNNKFLPETVLPFLRKEGLLVGAYPYFQENSKDLQSLSLRKRDYFNKDKILKKLEDLKMGKINTKVIGPITENNPYSPDIQDKELYLQIYSGYKEKNIDKIQ